MSSYKAGHMTALVPRARSSKKPLRSRGRPHMQHGPMRCGDGAGCSLGSPNDAKLTSAASNEALLPRCNFRNHPSTIIANQFAAVRMSAA